jgi:hypothetical protein
MSGARIRLIVAAVLFLGWMVWLALAVADKGSVDPVSRAQLTEATILVTAEVTSVEGKPARKVKVVQRLSATGPADGAEIDVANLSQAVVPGKGFPGDGVYLLPLVPRDGSGFSLAGLPRSPGYEPANPPHPSIYPWNEATRVQLKALGYAW